MKTPFINIDGRQVEITEGLYFGMPEEQYHSIQALSSSGMKNLLVSAPDFYFNSWLNPMRDEDAEDEDASEWRKFGKASHTRILEGKTVFDTLYCVEFLAPEGCLETISDLKKALEDLGIPSQSKWKKADYVKAAQMANPNALIFDVEQEKYFRETNGRIQLSQHDMRRIEIAAAMVEKHPELRYCFTGGYPEVSVIWKDNDLWFKARFDYLKPSAVVDLKTFTNKRNKPIDAALYEAMAGLKYHIQAKHYSTAGLKAIEFAQKGITTTYSVHRFGPSPEFLDMLAKSQGHEFFFVFQKKGGAPLARGKKFHKNLSMMECARASIDMAIGLFRKYHALYGEEIWVDDSSISDFEDSLFPVWATEL